MHIHQMHNSFIKLEMDAVIITTNCFIYNMHIIVMDVMKMGNIVPRVGIEPTSLAFEASILPLHNMGSLMSPQYPHLPFYAGPCLRGQCSLRHLSPCNCKPFNAHRQSPHMHIYRAGSTTMQCIAYTGSWPWQPVSWV